MNNMDEMLSRIRNTMQNLERYSWTKNISAGFIKEDILWIKLNPDNTFSVRLISNVTITNKIGKFNYRELEFMEMFLEGKRGGKLWKGI